MLCAVVPWTLGVSMPASALGQGAARPVDARQQLAARLDEHLTRLSAFGFSGGVLVVRDGEIVLCKGYGVAERSAGIPFTADTAFEIASVTKQITAAAVLKLEMMGKLRTSSRTAELLEGVPEDKAGITVHQLLTHTAGLERGEGDRSAVVGRGERVAFILGRPLISKPGTSYSYSNWGYTLLAAVIESCSGQTFQAFVREQFFDPLGMSRTGFYGDSSRWPRASVAHSYFETVEEGCPLDWPLTWAATGGGYVISTLPDLFRWETELRSGAILSAEAKQKLFSPYTKTDGSFDYAYGWHAGKSAAGQHLVFHAGYYKSFGTEYRRYLDDDLAVFVVTNEGYLGGTGQQVAVTDTVARIALGGEPPELPAVVRLEPEALARYCGTYELPSGSRLELRMRGARLMAEPAGQDAFDALFFADRAEPPDFDGLNAQAGALVELTLAGEADELASSLDPALAEAYRPMFDAGWSGLAKQFGPLGDFEVLGTAPFPSNDAWLRTYVRLDFERAPVIITFGYRDGGLFDLTTWEGAPNPGAVTLAPLSATTFATYDLWTGKTSSIEFRISQDGMVDQLTLDAHSRKIPAPRAH
jgi:CubicO group peptidase (beta-lactamase class C family)